MTRSFGTAFSLAGLMVVTLSLVGCDLTVEGPPEDTPTQTPEQHSSGSTADATCSNGRILDVAYTVDGDTLDLGGERVRLIGIDTPETYPSDEVECYGLEAKAQTTMLMDDATICLTYDPAVTSDSNNVDAYGRTLGYVFFGPSYSRFLNAELVEGGFANDYPFTEGAVFEEYFYDLEDYARRHDIGMWGVCY